MWIVLKSKGLNEPLEGTSDPRVASRVSFRTALTALLTQVHMSARIVSFNILQIYVIIHILESLENGKNSSIILLGN